MKGKTKGKVHPVFTKRIRELKEDAKEQADTFTSGGSRPYTRPAILDNRDLLHVPGLHDDAWDRNPININYDEVTQTAAEPGTAGDAASLKLQAGHNATEERAFRSRHASLVRCMVHMHGRLQGHGRSPGVFDRIESEASNLIKAGSV